MFRALTIALVAALALAGESPANAQLDIKTYEFGKNAHGFHGLPRNRVITTFQAESEAIRVFQQIIGAQGISARIEIRASGDVDNAAAFLDDAGTRIIAYNVLFMDEVKKKTGRYWSLISIMAHEVGHHLNFHTYVKAAPPPEESRRNELEADYFSGHALARLGASREDALAAMRAISPIEESSTHPGRDARLQAIALGWNAAAVPRPDTEVDPTQPAQAAVAEMQGPIDRLFTAWRNLDARSYLAQWAPDAVKINLKTGTRQSMQQLSAERIDLFAKLARVQASYTPTYRGVSSGTASFDVAYDFTVSFKAGRQFRDQACESYKVRKRGDAWLIIENQDYKPCP
jgi:hypothetical protein